MQASYTEGMVMPIMETYEEFAQEALRKYPPGVSLRPPGAFREDIDSRLVVAEPLRTDSRTTYSETQISDPWSCLSKEDRAKLDP